MDGPYEFLIKKGNMLHMRINKSNLKLLPTLLDEIHDRYFSTEQIEYDRERGEWRVLLGDSRKGPFNKTLRITKIKNYLYKDSERIVIYDINEIKVDLAENLIILDCNIPIVIKFQVDSDFEVILEPNNLIK